MTNWNTQQLEEYIARHERKRKENMKILAIDPGPTESALVEWGGEQITKAVLCRNDEVLTYLYAPYQNFSVLVIEQVKSYGMPVSDSIFDTVFWTGRFFEAWVLNGRIAYRVPRMTVKMHLCHIAKAKDTNIRQALIDRFEPGLKPKERPKGILRGLSRDTWAAFALAVTWMDQNKG